MSNYWIAASEGNLEAVRRFVETGGVDVNAADPQGYTAVHAAASYDHVELLEYLFSKGGNANVQDGDGDTPLHHCESVDTARILVAHGADWTLKNSEGQSPASYIVEEAEFPELGRYLQCLEAEGDAERGWTLYSTKDTDGAQFENQVKAFLTAPESELGPEMAQQRQQLEVIMSNANLSEEDRDAQLKEYVMGILGGRMGELTGEEEPASKRRK